MSGIPPHLETDPGVPSGEWAKSTTTAAFARSDPALGESTDAPMKRPAEPKPGVSHEAVPGAYPAMTETQADTHSGPQLSVKDSAVHAAEVGYAYAASAATTAASYLPRGVVDTVSSYMPTSHATSTMDTARASEHDVQHKTSFPTTEYSGAGSHEHIGGVGSLPGPMNEPGVAKLPDENTDQERYLTTGAAVGAAGAAIASGAYAAKEAVMGTLGQKSPADAAKGPADPATQQHHTTAVTSSTLPTHEPLGAHPGDHSMGVGALPGNQSEPHVARLPEESIHPQYDSGNVDTAAQVSMMPSEELHGNEAATGDIRHVGGVGALVGDQSEVSVAKTPEERQREHYHEVGPRGDPGSGVTGPVGMEGAVIERTEEPADVLREHHTKEQHAAEGAAAAAGVGGVAAAAAQHSKDKGDGPQKEESAPTHEEKKEGAKEGQGAGEREGAKETGAAGAAPKSGHHGKPNKGPGYETDYHPAEMHPRTETAGKPASSQAAEGEESLGATQADTTRPPEEQKPPHVQQEASSPAHKKATFMEKMKGEAKVLLGKIEGKHEKVLEGERMKHPEGKPGAAAEPQKETQTAPAEGQEQSQTAPVEQQKEMQA